MKPKQVVVIGAGIGGLASAIRLRAKGYEVTVIEASDRVGGKLGNLQLGSYRFDTGPSLFTMPHFVDELFNLCGLDPREHFHYHQKETICNYFWEDGTQFSASADYDRFVKGAVQCFNTSEKQLRLYLTAAAKKYDLTAPLFLERSLHKLKSYWHPNVAKSIFSLGKLDLNESLHEVNKKAFTDSRLIQFFDRFATYNGSSPYQTPGIMSMIPHLEMHYGTYFPKGGMYSIAQALYSLAQSQGVEFRLGEPVEQINYVGSMGCGNWFGLYSGRYCSVQCGRSTNLSKAFTRLACA